MLCAKLAMFTLYMRVFEPVRWMRVCCWVGIITAIPVYLSLVPFCAVYCFPHGNERWDLAIALKGSKMQLPAIVSGTYGVVSDVFLLILPLPIIFGLNLSLRKKIGLYAVFLAGLM